MKVDYPIVFFYYRDLEAVIPFYRDVLQLKQVRDQGWCKILEISPGGACLGLVDETRGSQNASDDKPVLLTLVVDDVDRWYQYLKEREVKVVKPPTLHEDIGVYCFFIEDPEGYQIEIQKFTDED